MGNCQTRFEKYLKLNHIDELESIARSMINSAKEKPFFVAEDSPVDYDISLSLYRTDDTVGSRCKTDEEIIRAYTGEKTATYVSGCGFSPVTFGEEISNCLSDRLLEIASLFVASDMPEVVSDIEEECVHLEENEKNVEYITEIAIEYGLILTMFDLIELFQNDCGILSLLIKRYEEN